MSNLIDVWFGELIGAWKYGQIVEIGITVWAGAGSSVTEGTVIATTYPGIHPNIMHGVVCSKNDNGRPSGWSAFAYPNGDIKVFGNPQSSQEPIVCQLIYITNE